MKKITPYLLIIISSLLSILSFSQPGSLDPTFGTGGKTQTNFSETNPLYLTANAVALQPDGKIVTIGKIAGGTHLSSKSGVFRYNQDGTPDTSFDNDGFAIIGIGPIFTASSITIQADAKIVVAGFVTSPFGNPDFALARYNADGRPDSSFDGDGILTTSIGDYAEAHALAIQVDGKIVVAGYSIGQFAPGVSGVITIARYNKDGSPDNSFDGDGIVTTIIGGFSSANSVAIQADDKIVVAGQSDNRVMIARYNSDGSLDNSFDADGIVTTAIGANSFANSVVIQSDSKIVIAGSTDLGAQVYFIAARYNTDGSLDNSFDADGIVTTAIGNTASANSMALQTDGKIILAGTSIAGNQTVFTMTRYNIDGSLDINFNNSGILTTVIGKSSSGNSVAIQTDGKILLAGFSTAGTGLAMSRYNTNGTLDNGFDGDGILIMEFRFSHEKANSIAIQSDGKIVLAGFSNTDPLPTYNFNSEYFFAIARYNKDGSLDSSFDGDGKLTSPASPAYDVDIINGVTVQEDGKIVIAGNSFASGVHNFAVGRYNANGSLDSSFDNDGILTGTFGYTSFATSVAIQTDGKILVGGYSSINAATVAAMARYNPDGSLDNSFDGDGKLSDIFGTPSSINSVVIQTDGKILAAGSGPNGFAIARLNTDGSFDNSFDGDGRQSIPFSSSFDAANAMALYNDGRILLAGETYTGDVFDFAMARLNADGSLDNSFDEDGKLSSTVNSEVRINSSVVIRTDGRIVSSYNNYNNSMAVLVCYNTDGSLDNSFGIDGKVVITELSGTTKFIEALEISENRIYIAGYSHTEKTQNDFLVAAYLAEATVQISCPSDTTVLAGPGQCRTVVNNIDPVVTPADNNAIINYKLSGATTINESGSASGQSFNNGVTTVTYSIAGEPEKTCSFTVMVKPSPEICGNGKDDDCDGRIDENCHKLPKIYITNTAVREGNSGTRHATFELNLSKTSDKPVTVEYHTADRTAQAPEDYEQKSGTVTFPPNTRTKKIVIKVKGDRLPEANERFVIILSDAVNGVIHNGRAVCTTIDDDPVPTITIHNAVADENCQQVSVRVSLSEPSERVVTLKYYTKDGSAKAPEDYTAISNGTLVFQPGEITKNISIVIKEDALCEPTEKFYVILNQAENASLNCREAEVRILNSDPVNNVMSKGAPATQVQPDKNRMIVSPNPANQVMNIRLLAKTIKGEIRIELLDQNGKIIKQWIKNYYSEDQSLSLQVADIPGGIYTVVIEDGKGNWIGQHVVIGH
jgi:uncharacterized delta-60 repeat protein